MDKVYEVPGTDMILLKKECPSCKRSMGMSVDGYKYNRYQSTNMLIADIFPELSVFEREFIMTGYCVKCQEKIFRRKATHEDKGCFC